ncbi:uncharacterized protein LOC127005923 [Eriocheir sinensis]|uniref:uncharacterized protein LOC127005923 n=1 Tax=Eriocheir sinensis TaxID=95602 RepID=UPI0021C83F9A|nr:uncharacterized protein LOC127005923 [Eriocheir sinensis]
MKWCLALVAVSLWAVAAAQTGTQCASEISALCPAEDSADPVFLPVPEDCGEYCECSNGEAWLFFCPPGTLFDEKLSYCLVADSVDCGSRPIP